MKQSEQILAFRVDIPILKLYNFHRYKQNYGTDFITTSVNNVLRSVCIAEHVSENIVGKNISFIYNKPSLF